MPVTGAIPASRLIQLQSFKETAWGTGAAATARWMGVKPEPQFKPMFSTTPIDEQRGSVVPAFIAPLLKKGGTFKIDGTCTYEDMLFILAGGMLGSVSPTGSNPYTWAFVSGSNSAWNVQPYTFELGYGSGQTIVANGCLIDKYSIKGEASKPWEYSVGGFYQTHTNAGTLTGAISDRTIEAILVPSMTCKIDTAGVAYGTTDYPSTLMSFSLDVTNGLKPIYTAGALQPIGFTYEKIEVKLKLELIYTAAVKTTLMPILLAGTGIGVQLKAVSGAKSCEIDFSGNMTTDPDEWGNKDGAMSIPIELSAVYDPGTPANYLKSTLINAVAAIP